jgi:hypothetical protein
MALLEMVNSVLGKIREERITAISASNLVVTEVIDLINDAGSEILEGNDWSFDVRHDGQMYWPHRDNGLGATFGFIADLIYTNTKADVVTLPYTGNDSTGELFENPAETAFRMSDPLRSRIVPMGGGNGTIPDNTSWAISTLQYIATRFDVTLANNLYTPTSAGESYTIYANEQVLPTTVRQVLSVRNEERDLPVEFIDRDIEFNSVIPRPHISFSDNTEVIFVGSNITSTSRTGGNWPVLLGEAAATTGTGAMIWPVPETDKHLHYSYRTQHADLSADADEWTGVPKNVIGAIEWLATQKAYDSHIRNDPKAGTRAERQVEKRIARALMNDNAQPNRRRIPRAYHPNRTGDVRRRWASQTIEAP